MRTLPTSLGFSIVVKLTYKVYKLHGLSKTVGDGFELGGVSLTDYLGYLVRREVRN